jgi:nucleotide-binding universal stress UspA family protein
MSAAPTSPIRDILVHLDATAPARTRLDFAAALAARHGARLTGLMVQEIALPPLATPDGGGAALVPLLEAMRRDAAAEVAALRPVFDAALQHAGIAGEWHAPEGIAAEQVANRGRYADLLVLGQDQPDGATPTAAVAIEAALFGAGRPVLLVPHAARFAVPSRHALIGWNASREAARAVHDALPLLAAIESATVLAVDARASGEETPGQAIAAHLARHGIRTEVETSASGDVDTGALLLNRAAELSADLLVIGGYGHSRLREWVLGGVTRTILREMTLPVLMSH